MPTTFNYFKCMGLTICLILSGCQKNDGITALGTLERDQVTLNALVNEQLKFIYVSEGDHVTSGQLLAQFDDRYAQTQLKVALAQLEQTKAALLQAQNGYTTEQIEAAHAAWQGAQANYQEAKRQFLRSQKLYDAKAIGKATLDNAIAVRDQTKALEEQTSQEWKALKNGTRAETLIQLQAQVDLSQAQVEAANVLLSHYKIVSPKDGVIDSSPWQAGDSITSGTQMFRLTISSSPHARVYLPQVALNYLSPGSTVDVFLAGKELPLTGKVRSIRSQPAYSPYFALNEKERSRLMYLTTIDLENAENYTTGLPLEIRIP